jgi:putative addiction module CopG family antidote
MGNTITISLTAELKELVQSKVRSGRYGNVSEVIREALRHWEMGDESEDPALELLINEGRQTESIVWSKKLVNDLKSKSVPANGRIKKANGKAPSRRK